MQKLQSLLFSKPDICSEDGLYIRCITPIVYLSVNHATNSDAANTAIKLSLDDVISTSTYFNLFSVYYWKTYTSLKDLKIYFKFNGRLVFKLIGVIDKQNQLNNRVAKTKNCNCIEDLQAYDYELKIISQSELISTGNEAIEVFAIENIQNLPFTNLYVDVLALEDSILYEDGGIYSNNEIVRNINLAMVTTTYKREDYISKNRILMAKYVPEDLKLFWYIVDNGQTLVEETTEKLSVLHNKNYGGAGGFGRGLYEAESTNRFSHIMYSDDDVDIEPRIYERVIAFYKYLTNPKTCLGGAMLSQKCRSVQRERFASLNGLRVCPQREHINLENINILFYNNTDITTDNIYFGWWFFVFPINLNLKSIYPLPLFFQRDDVDFSLRLSKYSYRMITFNSLSLWHEDFELKSSGFKKYYEARNTFILELYYENRNLIKIAMNLLRNLATELLYMQYDNCKLKILAYQDALKGAMHLITLDPEKLHKDLMAFPQDKFQKLQHPYSYNDQYDGKNKIWISTFSVITLFGNLLPGFCFKKDILYFNSNSSIFRKLELSFVQQAALLNKSGEYAILTKRSRLKFFKLVGQIVLLLVTLMLKFHKTQSSYRENYEYMTSRNFWQKYLNLKE